eukprot:4959139-Prymnesium_polylepis.1
MLCVIAQQYEGHVAIFFNAQHHSLTDKPYCSRERECNTINATHVETMSKQGTAKENTLARTSAAARSLRWTSTASN